MRRALSRRGYLGAPDASVLESKLLRLLRRHGIEPLAVEVTIDAQGHYRIDAAVAEDVLVEVDGYAYHHTPEQKTEDERRRNRIRLTGKFLLVYTRRDVVHDGERVIDEIREALRTSGARRLGSRVNGDRTRRTKRATAGQLTGAAWRPPVL